MRGHAFAMIVPARLVFGRSSDIPARCVSSSATRGRIRMVEWFPRPSGPACPLMASSWCRC